MPVPTPLDPAAGDRLNTKELSTDFTNRHTHANSFYQLKRTQRLTQPHDTSWQAFNHGNWDTALQLIEAKRPPLETPPRDPAAPGLTDRRLRIVEEPPGPYLQWELHFLHRHPHATIRVLPVAFLANDEHAHGATLPDLHTVDDTVMYHHMYNNNGVYDRTIRYTDPPLVTAWRDYIERLWHHGWPLDDYMDAYLQHLPPPQTGLPRARDQTDPPLHHH